MEAEINLKMDEKKANKNRWFNCTACGLALHLICSFIWNCSETIEFVPIYSCWILPLYYSKFSNLKVSKLYLTILNLLFLFFYTLSIWFAQTYLPRFRRTSLCCSNRFCSSHASILKRSSPWKNWKFSQTQMINLVNETDKINVKKIAAEIFNQRIIILDS